jgi:hypothetical protein
LRRNGASGITVIVCPSISQRMSTCRAMRFRICFNVWSIALRLTVPSMPGWMSKFTRVSRAIASSTSRTGWLATTTEYLISVSRASGGGGIGTPRTTWGMGAVLREGSISAWMWPSGLAMGRVPQPPIASASAKHAAEAKNRMQEFP